MRQSPWIVTLGDIIVNHFLLRTSGFLTRVGSPSCGLMLTAFWIMRGVSQVINDKLNSGRMMSKANGLMLGVPRRP